MTHLTMLARQWDTYWAIFRRTWRGTIISSCLSPMLYIGAMGVLLGSYIDDKGGVGGNTYVHYIVPGLLASTSMQIAMGECLWPVLGAIRWDKTYVAMIATPLRVGDLVLGHLWSVALRVIAAGAVFMVMMALVGGLDGSLPRVLAALLAQGLVAFAFAAPCYALATRVERDSTFTIVLRIVATPFVLFSGAFFPIENVGSWAWAARLSPLYHAVELTRGLLYGAEPAAPARTGDPGGIALHGLVLAAVAGVGIVLSIRGLGRRLLS